MTPSELATEFVRFVRHKPLTAVSLKILETKGTFGRFADGWPRYGVSAAEEQKLDTAKCYALELEDAVVMAYWNGLMFEVFFIDGVDRLHTELPLELPIDGGDAMSKG